MKLWLLWVMFVHIQVQLLIAEQERRASTTQTDVGNPEKPQTLFARGKYQRPQSTKTLGNPLPKAPGCSNLKESCAPESPSRCCDPCAFCHCRFFNTICRCWRLGRGCHRRT